MTSRKKTFPLPKNFQEIKFLIPNSVSQGRLIPWLNLLMGLAAGWFGVNYLGGPEPNWYWGVPLQLFAAWRIIKAFPPNVDPTFLKGSPQKIGKSTLPESRPLFLLLIFVSTALSMFFFQIEIMVLGLLFVFLSAFLVIRLRSNLTEKPWESKGVSENAILFIVLGIAILMRFPFLGQDFSGFQNDEACNILFSIQAAIGEEKSPFWVGWLGTSTLPDFLVSPFLGIFGITLSVVRGASAFYSILGLYVFYRLSRLYFSALASAIATFLFSIAFWELFFSSSGFTNIFTILFEISAFYFMSKALRDGKRLDFWWGGVFTATSILSYLSGRLVPIMIFLFVGACLIIEGKKFLKVYFKHLMLSFIAFFWLIGPYIFLPLKDHTILFSRSSELSIFNEIKQTGDYLLPLKTFGYTVLSFFSSKQMDIDARFALSGYTMVDAFSAFLTFVGLVLCFASFKKRLSLLCLVGFSIAACANALAINGIGSPVSYINGDRFFLIIPFVFLMAGRALDWIFQNFSKWKVLHRGIGKGIIALGLVWALIFNIQAYYFQFRQFPPNFIDNGYYILQLAKLYHKYYPSCRIISYPTTYNLAIRIIDWEDDLQIHKMDVKGPAIPFEYKTDRNVLLVFPNDAWKLLQEQIRKEYPNAVWTDVCKPWDKSPYVYLVEISKDDIQEKQKKIKPSKIHEFPIILPLDLVHYWK